MSKKQRIAELERRVAELEEELRLAYQSSLSLATSVWSIDAPKCIRCGYVGYSHYCGVVTPNVGVS